MPEGLSPLVLQAEAYHGDSYVLIRNSKTENAIDLTKLKISDPIIEVADFPAFLDATAGTINGARVIVALGDSRTANYSNWPRILAISHLRETDVVVVNLAEWARCSEEHVPVLEFCLGWLREHGAAGISVVFVAGLTDMHSKLTYYAKFEENNAPMFLSEAEEQLAAGSYSAELARLNEEVPTEWDVAYQWIARRIVAVVKILERLCLDAEVAFFAILEPNSYADYSPSYERALRHAYETRADADMPFEKWCRDHHYSRDPSNFHARDLRAILEELRKIWRVERSPSRPGKYVDWSGLFLGINECCFDEAHFDAVHYNRRGVDTIAGAVFELLGMASIPATVHHASGEMGTSIAEISEILAAVTQPVTGSCRVLDIGTQNIGPCTAEDVIQFIRRYNDVWDSADLAAYAQVVAAGSACHPTYGGINGAWLGDILSRAGLGYVAYDICEGFRTTIFDLNTSAIPAAERGSFDLVLNCGTSQHLLNQYNVFNVMHDAVRVGGVMHHSIPMTGYLGHGYFTYTPILLCDLARANQYEIVKMNFVGPQGLTAVSEDLVQRYADMVRFDPSDPIGPRWNDVRVPNGLVSVTLRRTSPAPFRAPLAAGTEAPIAKDILEAYGLHDDRSAEPDSGEAIKAKREAIDRSIESIFDRFTDPTLDYREIVRLFRAHSEAYAGVTFPPLLEKKSLELGLVEDPDREDLRARLEQVENALVEQWPLYRFSDNPALIDSGLIAMDGIEEKLLSIPGKQLRLRHAIAAFHRYLATGHPERYPLALEFDALRYLTEEVYPDDWAPRRRLGYCAAQLSNSMMLRRRAG